MSIPSTSVSSTAHGRLIRLDAGSRRARRQFDALVAEARAEVVAAEAGDLDAIWSAHRALTRAVGLLLDGRWDAA